MPLGKRLHECSVLSERVEGHKLTTENSVLHCPGYDSALFIFFGSENIIQKIKQKAHRRMFRKLMMENFYQPATDEYEKLKFLSKELTHFLES